MAFAQAHQFSRLEYLTNVFEYWETKLALKKVCATKCNYLFHWITPAWEGCLQSNQGYGSAEAFNGRFFCCRNHCLTLVSGLLIWRCWDSNQLEAIIRVKTSPLTIWKRLSLISITYASFASITSNCVSSFCMIICAPMNYSSACLSGTSNWPATTHACWVS